LTCWHLQVTVVQKHSKKDIQPACFELAIFLQQLCVNPLMPTTNKKLLSFDMQTTLLTLLHHALTNMPKHKSYCAEKLH